MTETTRITIAHGDGIGPEIMQATLSILEAAGAKLEYDVIEIGEKLYLNGVSSGIDPSCWDTLRKNKIFLKAPITTPQGGGMKSLNVTVRKALGLYANVRPCRAYHPFIKTHHENMDVVIVRENEEGLYGGIEHQQTPEVVQCLRIVSVPGIRRIARYAFEYAKQNNRHKVTCFTKDNIMKQTDGMFHKIFDEMAAQYPDIENEHMIIDIGSAKLAVDPERFDVILAPNLYGDIISDVAAEITGSVGLAGSANIGANCAMFEAIHGSAPDIAGKNMANPSGLLMGAVMMLVHIGQAEIASQIHNAWLSTIEAGIHTKDIYRENTSQSCVGTQEFAAAVIERLGEKPQRFEPVVYRTQTPMNLSQDELHVTGVRRQLVGVDVFLYWTDERKAHQLAAAIESCGEEDFKLMMIGNRGTMVWPNSFPETFCTDHWRCRFMAGHESVDNAAIARLLGRIHDAGLDFIKIENLYEMDGKAAFAAIQGA